MAARVGAHCPLHLAAAAGHRAACAALLAAGADLQAETGLSRIVVSEREAPNMSANLV